MRENAQSESLLSFDLRVKLAVMTGFAK